MKISTNQKNKQLIKCNSFDAAPGGMAGSVSTQPGWGTFASPVVSQNPNSFDSSNYNKYYNKDTTGQPDTQVMDNSGSFDKEVEKIFQKKEKPTPDDILCGIQYELQNMVKKDKRIAKERVIANIKKHGAKYYTKLGMLNIDDKDMDVNPIMQERMNILKQMMEEKKERRNPLKLNDAIQDILKEKRNKQTTKSNTLIQKSIKNILLQF